MKCPFCGEEMKSGYLKSGRGFYWGPDKELGWIEKDCVKLCYGFWKAAIDGFNVPSDYCPTCKKIITSVPEKE